LVILDFSELCLGKMTNFNSKELSETSIPGIKLKPGGSIKVSGDAKMKLIIDGKEIDLKNIEIEND